MSDTKPECLVYVGMTDIPDEGASDGKYAQIIRLPAGGDLEVSDWAAVRRRAREAHEAMLSGARLDSSQFEFNAHCALIWAAANPGVKP